MDCTLSSYLVKELAHTQTELERLDALFSETFNGNEGRPSINPSESFMAAWHKIKTARQTILSIQIEEATQ